MSFNFLFYLVKAHLLLFSPLQALSVDCPNVVNLAQGIGMESIQPSIWTSLKGDCCTVSSVTCVSQRVTQIYWYELGLNGVINGTAIPIGLTHLTLSYNWAIQGSIPSLLPVGLVKLHLIGNQITGSIPPALPSGLTDFNIYDNWVSGQIPLTLPSGLLIFQVNGNRMSGDVPLLPSTLRYLVLGFSGYSGNHFTGTIRITKPYDIHINNNWITDIIIQDISAFTVCDLSNNPLLGNPSIASLTMCTKTGLYSAGLLPNTKTTSRSITKTLTMTMTISSSSRSTTTLSSIRTTTSISTTMLRSTQITNFLTSKQTTNFVFSTSKLALKTPSISTVLLKSTTFWRTRMKEIQARFRLIWSL